MRMISRITFYPLTWLFLLACLSFAGCGPGDTADYGDPTQQNTLTLREGIWAQFIAPTDNHIQDKPETTVTLRAWTEENPPLPITVEGGHPQTKRVMAEPKGEPGEHQEFSFSVELLHGANDIEAVVTQAEKELRRLVVYTLYYEGMAPGLLLTGIARPQEDGCPTKASSQRVSSTNTDAICVYGMSTATDKQHIQSVSASNAGHTASVTTDENNRFVLEIGLAANTDNQIDITATDDAGASTIRTISILHSTTAPSLTITDPENAESTTNDPTIHIKGMASSAVGIQAVELYVGDELVGTQEGKEQFDFELPLQAGANTITVTAIDNSGNKQSDSRTIHRRHVITLKATTWRGGESLLQMDADALGELIDEAGQKSLTLANVPIRPFLFGAIDAIRNPLKYGTDPESLGQAEYNFYRLLNLSADSADLTGTSLEELSELAYAIGLPTAMILAQLLGMDVDEPALSTDLIADVLMDNLILTHPNAQVDENGDPFLQIRLYDALRNLEPLADVYGPSGSHPGIIGGAIHAEVMEPGFLMSARAQSHLIPFDGISASSDQKAQIYILDGDQVLSLDVDDDDTFSIVGLVDEPVVDVTISLNESPDFISSGTVRQANPDPKKSGVYRGNSAGWDLDPWILERIVLDTTYRKFVEAHAGTNYVFDLSYNAGTIQNAAKFHWERGWFSTTTAGGLGDPPRDQYVWDTLLELAQVRLHDGGLQEGQANAKFQLKRVPVGINSAELIDAIRPALKDQEAQLSDMLLGEGGIAPSDADIYFVETVGGNQALFYYRHEDDAIDGPAFPRPGFFSDSNLSQRIDSTSSAGSHEDTKHRKIKLAEGESAYFADKNNVIYKLSVSSVREKEVDVILSQEEN